MPEASWPQLASQSEGPTGAHTNCAGCGNVLERLQRIEATLERSEQVVALCEGAAVPLGVVFQNRTRSPHQRLRALMQEGRIGDLVSAAATVRWWRAPEYYAEPGRGMKDRDGGGDGAASADGLLGGAGRLEVERPR